MKRLRSSLIGCSTLVAFALSTYGVWGQTVDPASHIKTMDAIYAKYKSLAKLPSDQRGAQTVAFIKTLKDVESARVTTDMNVTCMFRDKMPYTIVASARSADPGAKPSSLLLATIMPPSSIAEPSIPTNLSATINPFSEIQALKDNDLPETTNARICQTLGKVFGNTHEILRRVLAGKNYQVAPGDDGGLETLIRPGTNGFFYYSSHGGYGDFWNDETKKTEEQYCLSTATIVTPDTSNQVIQGHLNTAGMVGVMEAGYDYDPRAREMINRRTFSISTKFIKRFWKFSKNSLVIVDACNSYHLANVMGSSDVNASVFVGFEDITNGTGSKVVEFAVDRMLGANDDFVLPHEEGWPQRPFNHRSVEAEMTTKRHMYPFRWKLGIANINTDVKFFHLRDSFGLLAPSIRNLEPVAHEKKLDLIGIFGKDPGDQNRSVTINNVAMVVDKWEPDKITILLPDPYSSCTGEVKVISRGRPSNSRWLSNWIGTTTMTARGEGSLALKAEFFVKYLGDPWSYREQAGDLPTLPFVWTLLTSISSTCSWSMKGEEKDSENKVIRAWDGGGNPAPALNSGTLFKQGTFGIGAVGDSFQKLVNVTMAIVDKFSYNDHSDIKPAPVKLGDWMQGQSLYQAKYDMDNNVFGGDLDIDDEPSRLSYGGHTAHLNWTPMQCRSPMPRNAAR